MTKHASVLYKLKRKLNFKLEEVSLGLIGGCETHWHLNHQGSQIHFHFISISEIWHCAGLLGQVPVRLNQVVLKTEINVPDPIIIESEVSEVPSTLVSILNSIVSVTSGCTSAVTITGEKWISGSFS